MRILSLDENTRRGFYQLRPQRVFEESFNFLSHEAASTSWQHAKPLLCLTWRMHVNVDAGANSQCRVGAALIGQHEPKQWRRERCCLAGLMVSMPRPPPPSDKGNGPVLLHYFSNIFQCFPRITNQHKPNFSETFIKKKSVKRTGLIISVFEIGLKIRLGNIFDLKSLFLLVKKHIKRSYKSFFFFCSYMGITLVFMS